MLILDTNYLSEFDRATEQGHVLLAKLSASAEPVATTIVCVEEQLRGRLAQTARIRDLERLITAYEKLQITVERLSRWLILPWNADAVSIFTSLRNERLGLGTMDLKIASIAIANQATLLSRNLRDFRRIPNLIVEDWLQ